jgi:hypothetical protein
MNLRARKGTGTERVGSPEKQVLRDRSEEVKNLGGGRVERREKRGQRREEGNEVSKPTEKRVKQVAAQ